MGGYFMVTGVDMGVRGVAKVEDDVNCDMFGVENCNDDVAFKDEPGKNMGFNFIRETVKSPRRPNTRKWKWETRKEVVVHGGKCKKPTEAEGNGDDMRQKGAHRCKNWNQSRFFVEIYEPVWPILLKLDNKDKRKWVKGNKGFRFELFWLKNDDYESIVKEAWAEYGLVNSVEGLRGKLVWCATKLEDWSKLKFGFLWQKINKKQKELESLFESSHEQGSKEKNCSVEKELERLLDRQELYWKQRSMVDWLMEGDHNSKLFHAKAFATKTKNIISMLVDDEGRTQTSEEGIIHTVCSFFCQLFKYDNPSQEDLDKATVGLSCKIDDHMKGIISGPFEREEVRAAILEMDNMKSSGPNGF
ncbi:hypothetical protein Ddye_014390 [Dipteronia dyeriana]|uniref:Uncharacterized protein n=1 Tax=Dipteronia dyeriana TaxID=168575 RepID=A0AAE0CKJ8_9ROSI|nr:hypothetical protein Ddye_014390 [Dipteronia dyeriana]